MTERPMRSPLVPMLAMVLTGALLTLAGCRSSQKNPPQKPAPIAQATVQLSGDPRDAAPGEELDALAKLLLADLKIETVILHAAEGTTAIFCVGTPGTDEQMLESLVRARLSDAALAGNRFVDASSAGPVQAVATIPAPQPVTRPEVVVSVRADVAARYGMSVTELDEQIAKLLQAKMTSRDQIDTDKLAQIPLQLRDGNEIRLGDVAEVRYEVREVEPIVLSYPR